MYTHRSQQEINYEYTLHARRRRKEQDTTPEEIAQTVENGSLIGVRDNKGSRKRIFREGYTSNHIDYCDKELTVVYAMEKGAVVVVTLVTRYGRFERGENEDYL